MPLGPADIITPVVTALPSTAGLADGTEILYKAGAGDDAPLWPLKYDASITDAYKWRVKGLPVGIEHEVAAAQTVVGAVYAAMTTPGPTITLPLSGVYEVTQEAYLRSATNSDNLVYMSYDVTIGGSTTNASNADAMVQRAVNVASGGNASRTRRKTFAGAATLTSKYRHGDGGGTVEAGDRVLRARPLRVG